MRGVGSHSLRDEMKNVADAFFFSPPLASEGPWHHFRGPKGAHFKLQLQALAALSSSVAALWAALVLPLLLGWTADGIGDGAPGFG